VTDTSGEEHASSNRISAEATEGTKLLRKDNTAIYYGERNLNASDYLRFITLHSQFGMNIQSFTSNS
jgi:hypothetical protein